MLCLKIANEGCCLFDWLICKMDSKKFGTCCVTSWCACYSGWILVHFRFVSRLLKSKDYSSLSFCCSCFEINIWVN